MTDYQLWHGDCLEEMDRIESGSVDAIICDLPFGQTASKWDKMIPFESLWKHYKRIIKPKGAIVLFGSEPFTSLLITSNLSQYRYSYVWIKNKATGFLNAKKMPLNDVEDIAVFGYSLPLYFPQLTKGKRHGSSGSANGYKRRSDKIYGDMGNTVRNESEWYYPKRTLYFEKVMYPVHPTQKPLPLMINLIRTYTNEGETVLDNTFGSCSTGEAALRTGRRFIGIEKDANYFEIGKARMERVAAELRGELNHLPMFQEAAAV